MSYRLTYATMFDPPEDLHRRFMHAASYQELALDEFVGVSRMLADGFTTHRGRRSAHLHFDRVNGVLRGSSQAAADLFLRYLDLPPGSHTVSATARHAPTIIVIAPTPTVRPIQKAVPPIRGVIRATRYKPAFTIVAE